MPAQIRTLVEQALALLDAAGEGASLAACNLQSALAHLGQPAGPEEADHLLERLWPADETPNPPA